MSDEVQKRYALFFLIASTASAFAGVSAIHIFQVSVDTDQILAYGLMQMNGVAGKAGWEWIFIIEGLITVLVGIGGLALLVDFPDSLSKSSKFLSPREVCWVLQRIEADRGDGTPEPFAIRKFLGAARNPLLWLFSIIFL
jgi:hypothetical protein